MVAGLWDRATGAKLTGDPFSFYRVFTYPTLEFDARGVVPPTVDDRPKIFRGHRATILQIPRASVGKREVRTTGALQSGMTRVLEFFEIVACSRFQEVHVEMRRSRILFAKENCFCRVRNLAHAHGAARDFVELPIHSHLLLKIIIPAIDQITAPFEPAIGWAFQDFTVPLLGSGVVRRRIISIVRLEREHSGIRDLGSARVFAIVVAGVKGRG